MAAKVTQRKKTNKRIRLQEGEKVHVGLDVHKRSYHVAIYSSTPGRGLVARWVQPPDFQVLHKTLFSLKSSVEQVVYEAGPTGFSLARTLQKEGYSVKVIAPGHTPTARVQESKSDGLDCVRLAEFSVKDLLKYVYIPTEEEDGARQVSRHRDAAVRKVARLKCQIKSFLLYNGIADPPGLKHWSLQSVETLRTLVLENEDLRFCLDDLLDSLREAQARLSRLNERGRRIIRREEYREASTYLATIAGVGAITILTVLTEFLAPDRFDTALQVSKYQGLCPLVRSSGGTRREMGRHRGGNRRLRTMIVEASWRWVRRDPYARSLYEHYLKRTSNKKKAIVAVARRLGIIIWRMLTRMEPYREKEAA